MLYTFAKEKVREANGSRVFVLYDTICRDPRNISPAFHALFSLCVPETPTNEIILSSLNWKNLFDIFSISYIYKKISNTQKKRILLGRTNNCNSIYR